MNHRFPPLFALGTAALLCLPQAQAQDWHAVGTGTNTNGPNGVPCPFGDIYAGQRAQYIYLASELSAAGLQAGDNIVSIRWVVTALNGTGMHENYTIRIGHTAANTLSGFLGTPSGAVTTPVDHQPVLGNNDFTFNNPFTWNGTSNVLVEVAHYSVTYGTASANPSVAFTSTAPAKRSYSLLDDLMFMDDQTVAFSGETLNSTGLPNIVFGVATACPPLTVSGMELCAGETVPAGQGLSADGCTEALGGRFTATYTFQGSNLECTGTDYTVRSTITLPALPAGAELVRGRLVLTGVSAEDPVWMSDLYLKLEGAVEGEIQLMPAFDNYSGTVPKMIVSMSGPYEAGVVDLSTASTFGTGHIGGARLEFDYLLPTPLWWDAPTGGNLVAYGESVIDPVALGLASTASPGTTTLHVDCGVSSTSCIGSRAPVDFTVVASPVPSFEVDDATVVAGIPASLTYTGDSAVAITWDFGDGQTGTGDHPVHTWEQPGSYTVTVTADNGNCTAETSMSVTVEVNTGIANAERMANVHVFATPEAIIIEQLPGAVHVDVFDAVGRAVITRDGTATGGRITLPAHGLHTGVWFVRVKNDDIERTFRVPLVR